MMLQRHQIVWSWIPLHVGDKGRLTGRPWRETEIRARDEEAADNSGGSFKDDVANNSVENNPEPDD